jgi:hypothetical protein
MTGPATKNGAPRSALVAAAWMLAIHSHERDENACQPSTSWRSSDASSARIAFGSASSASAAALTAKVALSPAIAQAGDAAAITTPAAAGPTTLPAASAAHRSAFACCSWDCGTSWGASALTAG